MALRDDPILTHRCPNGCLLKQLNCYSFNLNLQVSPIFLSYTMSLCIPATLTKSSHSTVMSDPGTLSKTLVPLFLPNWNSCHFRALPNSNLSDRVTYLFLCCHTYHTAGTSVLVPLSSACFTVDGFSDHLSPGYDCVGTCILIIFV